jgi:hypothetical protein
MRDRIESSKKPYAAPAVIHTEKLEGRAVVCDKGDDTCAGTLQS